MLTSANQEEEQERRAVRAVLEKVATHLGSKNPICYDSYCLRDLSHEKKLETFGVAMLKDMLKYFEIPFSCRDRKKNLVANLSELFLKAVSVTSRINAQTAVIISNRVFQPRSKKKSWKQIFFKNLKRRFMTFILFEKSN